VAHVPEIHAGGDEVIDERDAVKLVELTLGNDHGARTRVEEHG
jgi:hypothetical protein